MPMELDIKLAIKSWGTNGKHCVMQGDRIISKCVLVAMYTNHFIRKKILKWKYVIASTWNLCLPCFDNNCSFKSNHVRFKGELSKIFYMLSDHQMKHMEMPTLRGKTIIFFLFVFYTFNTHGIIVKRRMMKIEKWFISCAWKYWYFNEFKWGVYVKHNISIVSSMCNRAGRLTNPRAKSIS